MPNENLTQQIETASAKWQPARIEGVETLPLRMDRAGRKGSLLVRMQPGACYTRHRHPAGEEMLVLKGSITTGERFLKAGDFLYSPPGSVHELQSEKGCMFLLILPQPLEIVAGSHFEELDPQFETRSVPETTS